MLWSGELRSWSICGDEVWGAMVGKSVDGSGTALVSCTQARWLR